MEQLNTVIERLDRLFRINEFEMDPAFCRLFPTAYSKVDYEWKEYFEESYLKKFNGIMIKGNEEVGTIFCALTPTDEILKEFIESSLEGDMLLLHHPCDCENGDVRGHLGCGIIPAKQELLEGIRKKKLSLYSCHIPMDIHVEVGTGIALVKELKGEVINKFFPIGYGYGGLIFKIASISTEDLVAKLHEIMKIPYVDLLGKKHKNITKVAFVPGMGGSSELMKIAEDMGAEAYISGEILCRIDDDYGHSCFDEVQSYVPCTTMSLIGTSHDGSEEITMRTLLRDWVENNINVNTRFISVKRFWR